MKTFVYNSILAAAIAVAAVTAGAWHVPAAAQAAAAAKQSSVERGVTVDVTPKKLDAAGWDFAVVLDTHAEDLKDDLQKTALLVVDGREIQPIGWEGAGAGGHHREGVLRFPSAGENPAAVELRIQRAGEASPRLFRWDGAALE